MGNGPEVVLRWVTEVIGKASETAKWRTGTGLSTLCLSETDFSVFANPLGHSTLEMTRRYANLTTEDLQAVHQKISLLAA